MNSTDATIAALSEANLANSKLAAGYALRLAEVTRELHDALEAARIASNRAYIAEGRVAELEGRRAEGVKPWPFREFGGGRRRVGGDTRPMPE